MASAYDAARASARRPRTSNSLVEGGGGIGIDASDLQRLAVSMRTASRRAQRDFKVGMDEAATLIADEAKQRAGEHSSTIPATIKKRRSGLQIEIRAGAEGAPLARLFETGNVQKGRIQLAAPPGKKFRHPVFGNREVWVGQETHAFLWPAAAAKLYEARRLLIKVFQDALKAEQIEME